MENGTLYKRNRKKVQGFMNRPEPFVSLRCTANNQTVSGWFWQAFQTDSSGNDVMVWDLGYKPFP